MMIIQNIKKYLHILKNNYMLLYCGIVKLSKNILIFIGFIIVCWILWSRFIRERIPKDIPFELTELRFYILLYICGIYLYIVISIIKPREQNTFITRLVDILFTPLTLLDSSIKNNQHIKSYYNDFLEYIIPILDNMRFYERIFFVILIQLVPRFIFVSILLVDAFWIGKLEIVYYFIWLPIFPLIYRYIKYSIKSAKEEYISYLESIYQNIWLLEKNEEEDEYYSNHREDTKKAKTKYHDTYVTLQEYIKIHLEVVENNITNDTNLDYITIPSPNPETYKRYRINKNNLDLELTNQDYEELYKTFYKIQPNLLILVEFLDIQKIISEIWYIRLLKVVIYTGYLICWSYILFRSLSSLEDLTTTIKILNIIKKYANIEDPFGGIICYLS